MIKLSHLVKDNYVHPRNQKSDTTIDAYAEALGIGAEFPPIEIQHVSNYLEGGERKNAILIIDGFHRSEAYKKVGRKEIEAIEWQPSEILDYEKYKTELALEAAERNTRHGNRLGDSDKETKARQIALDDPDEKYTQELIAQKLGVSQQRISDWTKDIRARQKAGKASKIIRLSRLGWPQQEIAGVVGLDQSVISRIMQNTDFGEMHKMLSEGRPMEEIAEHYSIDLALAWALRLDEKEDRIRFRGDVPPGTKTGDLKELGWGIRTWDNWYFKECDKRFGDDWEGRIPAQLVAHTLFYFTRQGDLVFDPMAGGGVVPDTCLVLNRKCRAYDMVTKDSRPEVERYYWNPNNMQWPPLRKKPDLIFFDPPYFTKKAQEYDDLSGECEEGQIPISSLSREDYLAFFTRFFELAHKNTKDTTIMAFLNADWRDFQGISALDEMREKAESAINIFDYERLLSAAGWKVTHRIESHMSTQRFVAGVVAAMQEARILGTVGRTLLITKKEISK